MQPVDGVGLPAAVAPDEQCEVAQGKRRVAEGLEAGEPQLLEEW